MKRPAIWKESRAEEKKLSEAKPFHLLAKRKQKTNLEIKKVNVISHNNNIQICFTSIAQGLYARTHNVALYEKHIPHASLRHLFSARRPNSAGTRF